MSRMPSISMRAPLRAALPQALEIGVGGDDTQSGIDLRLRLCEPSLPLGAARVCHHPSVLGVDRHHLPENLIEYFGLFGTERQNVIRGVEFVRASPLIGAQVPVHGLLIDVHSGRLEWVVNGYQRLDAVVTGKVGELFSVGQLIPQPAVERFGVAVLPGRARLRPA